VNTANRSYCTYFDVGYLPRGLALIESLRRHGDDSDVWVLCLDDDTHTYITALADPAIHAISIADLESARPELLEVKSSRSSMEYYFTCTPQLVRHVMTAYGDEDRVIIYLDADLYFFDDPGLVLDALDDGAVGIIEHRYPPRLERRLRKYGRFNVGWVGFRNVPDGRECLDWWAASCLEWCSDTPDRGRYADQGYLDEFPERFQGVVVLEGAGLNLAPWNTGRHRLTGASGSSDVLVDDEPLVFFHFHGIKRTDGWFITSQLVYGDRMGGILRDRVYVPYLTRLEDATKRVAASGYAAALRPRGTGIRGLLFTAQRKVLDRVSIATGNAVRANRISPSD
jgi:hypothetical protein